MVLSSNTLQAVYVSEFFSRHLEFVWFNCKTFPQGQHLQRKSFSWKKENHSPGKKLIFPSFSGVCLLHSYKDVPPNPKQEYSFKISSFTSVNYHHSTHNFIRCSDPIQILLIPKNPDQFPETNQKPITNHTNKD